MTTSLIDNLLRPFRARQTVHPPARGQAHRRRWAAFLCDTGFSPRRADRPAHARPAAPVEPTAHLARDGGPLSILDVSFVDLVPDIVQRGPRGHHSPGWAWASIAFGAVATLALVGAWPTSASEQRVALVTVPSALAPLAAPAAARQAAPAQPPELARRLSAVWMADGHQLLDTYRAGLKSDRIEDRFLAREALGLCLDTLRNTPAPASTSGNLSDLAQISDDRYRLRQLCEPFADERSEDIQRGVHELFQSTLAPDSPFVSRRLAANADTAAKDEAERHLRAQFARYGAAALTWNSGLLADWLRLASDGPRATAEFPRDATGVRLEAATLVALCRLGFDCHTSSAMAMNLCAFGGVCARQTADDLLGPMFGDEERRKIETLARTLADAVTANRITDVRLAR